MTWLSEHWSRQHRHVFSSARLLHAGAGMSLTFCARCLWSCVTDTRVNQWTNIRL